MEHFKQKEEQGNILRLLHELQRHTNMKSVRSLLVREKWEMESGPVKCSSFLFFF